MTRRNRRDHRDSSDEAGSAKSLESPFAEPEPEIQSEAKLAPESNDAGTNRRRRKREQIYRPRPGSWLAIKLKRRTIGYIRLRTLGYQPGRLVAKGLLIPVERGGEEPAGS